MRRLLVFLGLLLAGCTTSAPGTPTAGDEPTSQSTTTTTGPTSADRPKDVDLAAVDLCTVVGALPRADLGLDTDRPPLAGDSSIFPGSKDCFANGVQANLSLLMVAVLDEGAGEFVESANAEVDQGDANGFPLYVLTNKASPDTCFGVLDVNDGQMLYISYGLAAPGTQPATPRTTLCQRIQDIATAALGQL